jgi:hypothetical protein
VVLGVRLQKIEAVSKILVKRLTEATPYAKAYLKASLSEIRVTDGIVSLSGENISMARLIATNGALPEQTAVPRTMHGWRGM